MSVDGNEKQMLHVAPDRHRELGHRSVSSIVSAPPFIATPTDPQSSVEAGCGVSG